MYYGNPNIYDIGVILSFTRSGALDRALDVVKAGLTNGSIKLQGASLYDDNNKQQIKVDCEYINALINSIADNLVSSQKNT